MHIRTVFTKKNGKVHRYAQLVQSFRRKDGKPSHKVLLGLGELSDTEIANFRIALEASRKGQSVLLSETSKKTEWKSRILANYGYLDAAVALEMWKEWKLTELLCEMIPKGNESVEASHVISALTIQRCIAPGSTYAAEAWFPKTALPELLGINPKHFNNTRLHRVLENLDSVDSMLQDKLPLRYQQRTGVFSAIYLDVTDTWFEGRGCEMAEFDRTKEGFTNRNKIGIVLTCNDLGFPLRWQVIRGKVRDTQSMTEMLEKVRTLSWAGKTPIVCDRAMGRQSSIAEFMASGLRFITATTRQEMESFTKEIPWQTIEDFDPEEGSGDKILKKNIAEAGKRAREAGFQKVEEHLYILDLGVKKRKLTFKESVPDEAVTCDDRRLSGAAALLAKARRFKGALSRKEVKNQVELAKREGMSRRSVCRTLEALRLDASLQEDLLAGHFGYVPQSLLAECVKMKDRRSQKKILDEHALTALKADRMEAGPRRTRSGRQNEAGLRLVAYFNPEMCVEMRLLAREHQREIETLVSDLNKRLDNPKSHFSGEKVCSKIARKLKENNLLGVYSVEAVDEKSTEESKRPRFQIRLHFNKEEWRRRRRYDGFVLIVGHPKLPNSAVEIIRFYRQKDKVEKDFQTIKSVVKLRPVWHRTDPKVRAHVTLCILALLLERSLEYRLKEAGNAMSAPKCFEELKTCHMNLLATDPDMPPLYVITEPTVEQMAILKSLGVSELLDNLKMAAQIHHR